MKRALPITLVFILVSSMAYSQFIEEYRSKVNRKPPNSLMAQIDGFQSPRDINGNGSEDFPSLYNDSLFCLNDGLTFEVILSMPFKREETAFEILSFEARSPNDPNKNILATHIVGFYEKSTPGLHIYDVDDGRIVYSNMDLNFIGVADFDKGGMAEILTYDAVNKQSVILGIKDADLKEGSPEEAPIFEPLGSPYSLELKFQGRPQRKMVEFLDLDEARRKFDINKDGNSEVVLFKLNDQRDVTGLEVVNPKNGNVLWDFDYPAEYLERMQAKFHGFLDVNGDDQSELFFGRNLVVTLDKEVHTLADGFQIVGFNDYNGDGYSEVIGINTLEDKVQVWGAPMTTGITRDSGPLEEFTAQVQPNPFNAVTTYQFNLTEAAHIQLFICNAQGQVVSTVFSGWKEAGVHQGRLNGLTHPGLYFMNWRINGHPASTLQIIKK